MLMGAAVHTQNRICEAHSTDSTYIGGLDSPVAARNV